MVMTQLINDLGRLRFGLLVGIGGGTPDADYEDDELNDIHLGDVVVSHSRGRSEVIVQFDRGKIAAKGFVKTGPQSRTIELKPAVLRKSLQVCGIKVLWHRHYFLKVYVKDILLALITLGVSSLPITNLALRWRIFICTQARRSRTSRNAVARAEPKVLAIGANAGVPLIECFKGNPVRLLNARTRVTTNDSVVIRTAGSSTGCCCAGNG